MTAATPATPAARLAEELAGSATAGDTDEVQVRVEDSHSTQYRTGYDGAVTRRSGLHRTVTIAYRLGTRWTTEVLDGGAAPPPAPLTPPAGPVAPADQIRDTVLDPVTGLPCPQVLGAEYQQTSMSVTVLAGNDLTQWSHTRRRLWHWVGGVGGNHLEGALTWGDQLPDPAVPRAERSELLAIRDALPADRGGEQPHGRMPVLLRPCVAMHLVDLLASMLNGRNALAGMRMLRERVGRRIAADPVTVLDDGGLSGPYGALLDDEGVATARNTLVEAGVLRGFLHSRATAAACGTAPNGCAVRTLPGGPVGPGARGFALLPGAGDQPAPRLGTGLEAVAVTRPAVRCAGGKRIRLEVFGWLVRDGRRQRPVGPVPVEVALFGWLRSVLACAPPLHHSAVFRGLAAPAVLLAEAEVGRGADRAPEADGGRGR